MTDRFEELFNYLDLFHGKNNYKNKMIQNFKEEFQKYTMSDHCRSSYQISKPIEEYFINEISNNLQKYKNKSFEEIFKYVNQIISKPVSKGGGKLNQKYGSRGIGVLGCYDISIALIKSIPGCSLPNKIYLIKDSSKGPWNYTTKILNINPIKVNEEWCGKHNIYYLNKEELLNNIINTKEYQKIVEMNCDDIESYLCNCWKLHRK